MSASVESDKGAGGVPLINVTLPGQQPQAGAVVARKRGRRRQQTIPEQTNGLDRVFIWDLDSSLVRAEIVSAPASTLASQSSRQSNGKAAAAAAAAVAAAAAAATATTPPTATAIGEQQPVAALTLTANLNEKLAGLSKRLRELTLAFCQEHLFLGELEMSEQMHIDDVPSEEAASAAVSLGAPPGPGAPMIQKEERKSPPQQQHQPQNQTLAPPPGYLFGAAPASLPTSQHAGEDHKGSPPPSYMFGQPAQAPANQQDERKGSPPPPSYMYAPGAGQPALLADAEPPDLRHNHSQIPSAGQSNQHPSHQQHHNHHHATHHHHHQYYSHHFHEPPTEYSSLQLDSSQTAGYTSAGLYAPVESLVDNFRSAEGVYVPGLVAMQTNHDDTHWTSVEQASDDSLVAGSAHQQDGYSTQANGTSAYSPTAHLAQSAEEQQFSHHLQSATSIPHHIQVQYHSHEQQQQQQQQLQSNQNHHQHLHAQAHQMPDAHQTTHLAHHQNQQQVQTLSHSGQHQNHHHHHATHHQYYPHHFHEPAEYSSLQLDSSQTAGYTSASLYAPVESLVDNFRSAEGVYVPGLVAMQTSNDEAHWTGVEQASDDSLVGAAAHQQDGYNTPNGTSAYSPVTHLAQPTAEEQQFSSHHLQSPASVPHHIQVQYQHHEQQQQQQQLQSNQNHHQHLHAQAHQMAEPHQTTHLAHQQVQQPHHIQQHHHHHDQHQQHNHHGHNHIQLHHLQHQSNSKQRPAQQTSAHQNHNHQHNHHHHHHHHNHNHHNQNHHQQSARNCAPVQHQQLLPHLMQPQPQSQPQPHAQQPQHQHQRPQQAQLQQLQAQQTNQHQLQLSPQLQKRDSQLHHLHHNNHHHQTRTDGNQHQQAATLKTVLHNHHKQLTHRLSIRFNRIKSVYNMHRGSASSGTADGQPAEAGANAGVGAGGELADAASDANSGSINGGPYNAQTRSNASGASANANSAQTPRADQATAAAANSANANSALALSAPNKAQHVHAYQPITSPDLVKILAEIDHYTLDWRKRSMDCLRLISESPNCTSIIVTKLPLVLAFGNLVCLGLSPFFEVDQVYSASKTSKEACIKRIKKRFGAANRCSYIIVGDRDDSDMAKRLDLPCWTTSRAEGHRQLLQLYTALKEGYLM